MNKEYPIMKINIISIIYTVFSIAFLIALSIFKGTENVVIDFFAYLFMLLVQYRILVFKEKAFRNYITVHPVLNYVILSLGFFYFLLIGILLAKNIIKIPFGYFVLAGCASSCFYTFFICKKSIDE